MVMNRNSNRSYDPNVIADCSLFVFVHRLLRRRYLDWYRRYFFQSCHSHSYVGPQHVEYLHLNRLSERYLHSQHFHPPPIGGNNWLSSRHCHVCPIVVVQYLVSLFPDNLWDIPTQMIHFHSKYKNDYLKWSNILMIFRDQEQKLHLKKVCDVFNCDISLRQSHKPRSLCVCVCVFIQ